MKRIFIILVAVLMVVSLSLPCFANEAVLESETAGLETVVDDTAYDEETMDVIAEIIGFVKYFFGEYAAEMAAAVIGVVAIVFKKKFKQFVEVIFPAIKKQVNATVEMAAEAGKITVENKKYVEDSLSQMKKILENDEEREKRLVEALETERKTTEEYRAMCEGYEAAIKEFAAAALSQGSMVYDALMSAKLTDVRKEEIEKQYLKGKAVYEAIIFKEDGGDVSGNEEQ